MKYGHTSVFVAAAGVALVMLVFTRMVTIPGTDRELPSRTADKIGC